MTETQKHRDTIERAKDTTMFAEGGVLGMLERAKAKVEALAYFAAPELGDDAAFVREVLLLTIEDAIAQVQQDDAFTADLAKRVA